MADKQVRARVSEDVSEKIDSIVGEINDKVPEANVNVSSILRYAIEEYVKRYDAKQNDSAVFVELPTMLPNEDLEALCENLIAIRKIYQNVNHPLPDVFSKQLKDLNEVVNHLAVKADKPNNDRTSYEKRLNELFKNVNGEEDSE